MKDLDALNPPFARPSRFIAIGAVLPLLASLAGAGFANGAAPNVTFFQNPLVCLCLAICAASCAMLIVPRLFNWDWRTGYFGFSLLFIFSISIFGGVPWLCILYFSSAPLWLRGALFSSHAFCLLWWASRYVRVYRTAFGNDALRDAMYEEDGDCFYYRQHGDRMVLDTVFHFKEFPSTMFTLSTLAVACGSMVYARELVNFFGLPYAHLFLAIFSISVNMIGVGFLVRGWLVFFKYPTILRRRTGKMVYVDMVTKPAKVAMSWKV